MKQTKIENDGHAYSLVNCRVYPKLSEETTCFEALLYVDGKKFAHISNRGKGGPHDIYPISGWSPWMRKVDFDGIITNLLVKFEEEEYVIKHQDKGIVYKRMVEIIPGYSVPEMYTYKLREGRKLLNVSDIVKIGGSSVLKGIAKELTSRGYEVLNTNF